MKEPIYYDAVIIGGGLAGASVALVLAQLDFSILLVEKNAAPLPCEPFEARTLAFNRRSIDILEQLGLWTALQAKACVINRVTVNVQKQFGSTQFSDHQKPLGVVVGFNDFHRQLYAELAQYPKATIIFHSRLSAQLYQEQSWQLSLLSQAETMQVKTGLLIGADGTHSQVRRLAGIDSIIETTEQAALIGNIQLSQPLAGQALERFLPQGTQALVPWQENYATMIWTLPTASAQQLANFTNADYLHYAQTQLGYRWGKIAAANKPWLVKLDLQQAQSQIAPRLLLLGNAAHSVHPIAAQGFNLTMRDIWQLRQQALGCPSKQALGDAAFLQTYVEARRADQRQISKLSQYLVTWGTHPKLPGGLKSLALLTLDTVSPLKKLLQGLMLGQGL